MIAKLWKQWKNSRDEKQLAAYAARDAQLGTPTKETLTDRAVQAARSGYWKTAIAAIDAGADVNTPVNDDLRFEKMTIAYRKSIAHLAAEQNNAAAMDMLLERGASRTFVGSVTVSGQPPVKYTVLEYAVLQGAKDTTALLLQRGGNPQEALDGALKIAAREKSYTGMTQALLDAGAKDFDGAQRAAEVYKNDAAIPLIKGAAKKAFDAAQRTAPDTAPPAPAAPVQHVKP